MKMRSSKDVLHSVVAEYIWMGCVSSIVASKQGREKWPRKIVLWEHTKIAISW